MPLGKVSYKDFIKLGHEELSKKDPHYFEKVNEIIESQESEVKQSKNIGFFSSLKKFFKSLLGLVLFE